MKARCVLVFLLLAACRADPQDVPQRPSKQDESTTENPKPVSNTPSNGDVTPKTTDQPPTTQRAAVAAEDVPGFAGSKIFLPRQTPAPAIILFHGSEGGKEISYLEEQARAFAEQGFVALSFCWFDCQGLPTAIQRIRLERTMEAIEWLRQTPHAQGQKIGMFGWSRGGEKAVLLASLVQSTVKIAAIAVNAASDTVVCGYDPATQDAPRETDPTTGRQIPAAAWTWQGTPLYGEKTFDTFGDGPAIEIEKFAGPLYISHGMEDPLWEVGRGQQLEQRRKLRAGLLTEAHFWEGEGHVKIEDPTNKQQYEQTMRQFFETNLR